MDTINKLKKWLFWLMLIIAATWLLTRVVMLRPPVSVSYEVMFDSPRLVMEEINATNARVELEARITNTTGVIIPLSYVEFEFLNERGTLMGAQSYQIRHFSPNQTVRIDMSNNVRNVDSIQVRFVEADHITE